MSSPEAEEIVKAKLSELDFRRWQMLMRKIDDYEMRRLELQKETARLNKHSENLYSEMRKLWEFTKVTNTEKASE